MSISRASWKACGACAPRPNSSRRQRNDGAAVMPAHAGIHDLPSRNRQSHGCRAGACPRAGLRPDPWARHDDGPSVVGRAMRGYNFAYLDEQTKRMIRRAILKAVAVPGHQVPFGSREMPLPYGWGTGGIQLTAAILGPEDVLKVIDQGADDTTNAVSIRKFF